MAATIHQPPFGTILASQPTPGGFKPIEAAQSLKDVLGGPFGRIVFDLGFIGMACGAISAHMVCCGFTVCEMFGLKYTPKRYRMFTLVPAIGILGVMIQQPIWLPVIASAIAFTMLPIAYISFFYLNNKKSYLGDAVPKGAKGKIWNILLLIAVLMSVVGASIQIKSRVIDKILPQKPAASATK
jgi:Mn2+/Fe2+ NRAMP family transporter